METTKETVVTQDETVSAPVKNIDPSNASKYQTIEYLIYFMFGVLEVLLVFRLFLRMTGASMTSPFVGLVYSLTSIFISPFIGIFHQTTTSGVETTAVFEPATLISLIVYAILAFGIVKLVKILSGKKQQ